MPLLILSKSTWYTTKRHVQITDFCYSYNLLTIILLRMVNTSCTKERKWIASFNKIWIQMKNRRISASCHEAGPFEESSWHEIYCVSNGMNWNLIKADAIIELGSFVFINCWKVHCLTVRVIPTQLSWWGRCWKSDFLGEFWVNVHCKALAASELYSQELNHEIGVVKQKKTNIESDVTRNSKP